MPEPTATATLPGATIPAATVPPPTARSAHDERLLALVHPTDWPRPSPAARYDLVVVGAGTAGLVSAAGAAGLGARVALVERHLLGGDCLNVGCVPSKALIAAARAWQAARTAGVFGAPAPAADAAGDAAVALERMRAVRAHIAPADSAPRFRDLGVDVFFGDACFTAPDAVEVDGTTLRFRRAVIATGGRPAVPPVAGLADVGYLTNESVFDLADLPRRLLVVGAGPIGCELAQAFARLGSHVTVLDRDRRILPREDEDVAAVVQAAMERDGITFALGVSLTRAGRAVGADADGAADGDVVLEGTRDGQALRVAGDAVLVAAGRLPNVEGLGLEAAGVAYTARGVTVDAHMRTSNRRVFAVGDVSSPLQFTHAADAQARATVQNAFFFGRKRRDRMVVPRATFTSPEVASVGFTRDEARAAGVAVDEVTVPFAEVDRAITDGDTDGFLRVLLRPGGDRILGVTIVGAQAGELIGEAAVALTNGLGLGALGATIHVYPTRAEAFRKAADRWRRGKLTPRVQRLFALWFRVFRRLT